MVWSHAETDVAARGTLREIDKALGYVGRARTAGQLVRTFDHQMRETRGQGQRIFDNSTLSQHVLPPKWPRWPP
jgi:hypothetical protein